MKYCFLYEPSSDVQRQFGLIGPEKAGQSQGNWKDRAKEKEEATVKHLKRWVLLPISVWFQISLLRYAPQKFGEEDMR